MSHTDERVFPVPRWLHAWAVLTACAALPLVTLGAEVTTKQVGMADRIGFREPWYFFTLDLRQTALGPLIEHGHRLAGFVVGICCIVLAVGLTFAARRPLQRWIGWAALLAVSLQGILGIFRVNLHDVFGHSLRTIHACFAQLVFALLVTVAVVTARTWITPLPASLNLGRIRTLALVLSGTAYIQVVFGAIMRHLFDPLAQRLHILLAFAVVALAIWLVRELWTASGDRVTRTFGILLLTMLFIQPVLGLEAWIGRFGGGQLPELVPSTPLLDTVRSGHHVLGTLIFATTVILAVLLRRPISRAVGCPEEHPVLATASSTTSDRREVVGSVTFGGPVGSTGGAG